MECPGLAKRQYIGRGGDENRCTSSGSSSRNLGKPKPCIYSNGEYGHPPEVPRVIRVKDGHILDSVASQTISAMMRAHWPFGAVNFTQANNISATLFILNIYHEFGKYYRFEDGVDQRKAIQDVIAHMKATMKRDIANRYKELRDGRSQCQESGNKGDIDLWIEASRLVTWNELLAEAIELTLENYSTSFTFNALKITPEQLRIVVQEVLSGYSTDDLVSILTPSGQTEQEQEANAISVKLFADVWQVLKDKFINTRVNSTPFDGNFGDNGGGSTS